MDILIHVSAQDINRNLRRYIKKPSSPLDLFAPAWPTAVRVLLSERRLSGSQFKWTKDRIGSGVPVHCL
jgi:hypothetical protein